MKQTTFIVNHRSRGTILVAILVVTVLSAMIAASLLYRVQAEVSAASSSSQGEQAYLTAMSGVETVLGIFNPPNEGDEKTPFIASRTAIISDPLLWYDNPDLFRYRLVADDGANRWYFCVYSQNHIDPNEVRFGLTDETGKININTADESMLASLPGMTPELVDSLLDYRDEDEETRTDGAEQDYYDRLPEPYIIKNGPLTTMEELLLVKGFNASIVFGEDANLNGLLEPNEDDGDQTFPPDDNDGELNAGLYGSATTFGYGVEVDSEGNGKVNINSGGVSRAGLSSQTVQFIEAYRRDGNQFIHPSQLLNMSYTTRGSQGGRGRFGRGGGGSRQTLTSGVNESNLAEVMEKLTTVPNSRVPLVGVVNVNTASSATLAALPGIDQSTARQIVETRSNLEPQTLATTAWLLSEGVLDADTYKTVAPRLTSRGYQFRMKVIGFGVPSGRYRILEVVIDVAQEKTRILYLRDVTRLGVPFPLTPENEEL